MGNFFSLSSASLYFFSFCFFGGFFPLIPVLLILTTKITSKDND